MRASAFKGSCPKVVDRVRATGESGVLTKQGAPVVQVIPVELQESDIFGFMAGEFVIVGDIESPLVPLRRRKVLQK